jgi:Arc/MetJ-type ribon-helix-helix transcriptional regulator
VKTISLKLPPHLTKALEKEAKSRRSSKSEIIRDALEKALAPQKSKKELSCYDLSRDLVGSVKGAPRDLSVNPKYMEGFGE